jgi:hypothetical protein
MSAMQNEKEKIAQGFQSPISLLAWVVIIAVLWRFLKG